MGRRVFICELALLLSEVMPGRIDTHVHMELPFMGTISADDFYRNCFTGLAGGTTLIMDFCVAFPGTRLTEAYEQNLVKSSKINPFWNDIGL
jgi:dihydroorotase-like cyclic amidohydrolase